ncbi:MAG: glycoside hydrolase 15-related [Roseomonas sp.]|nr:glycoside hydrolase 15-related [Roseomonas sp.]
MAEAALPVPRPIEDHAVIGDLSTMALVGKDGTIDFMCWPHFDSPSIFAALLDPAQGGHFTLAPDIADTRVVQMYLPDTNILLTRWLSETASAEVIDLMPVTEQDCASGPRVIRRVRVTRGRVTMGLRCAPRFDYARARATATLEDGHAWFRPEGGQVLRLTGPVRFTLDDRDVVASLTLNAGQEADFVLDEGSGPALDKAAGDDILRRTTAHWQEWTGRSTYRGRWRNMVMRSSLVLKLLTSRRHGSVLAAATFGLPEAPGGERNWDYRATWIRDASFTVYALMRLGYQKEAEAFTRWVDSRAREAGANGQLRIMYGVDGHVRLDEQTLPHLAGYGGARPVRIGNAAYQQEQLDIYGELLDSVYLSNKYGHAISHDDWNGVRRVVDHVCEHWQDADAGMWEVRAAPREFLHSRLMCWVAVDRALRLATKRSLAAPFEQWRSVRNEIYEDIWANFWNEELGHFVQSKGGTTLDGALLMMPLVRFVSATDPRWLATLDAIGEKLGDDGLIYRYHGDDGLPGQEGAFAACSFWYVECLARAGRMEQAHFVFEKLLNYANHVGLYAEEFSMRATFLGNFPQAFTHLALISAAVCLDREIEGKQPAEWRP